MFWPHGPSTTKTPPARGVGASLGAQRASGGPVCWGRNLYGGLGDGTTDDRSVPTPVIVP